MQDLKTNKKHKDCIIKLVALDLDGTTFNSKGELTDRTRIALEKAAEQGVYIVISTGRSFNSLPDSIKSVKGVSYAITSNGAHINRVENGESIYNSYNTVEAVEIVKELTKKNNFGIEIFVDGQAYMDEVTYNDIKENGSNFRNAAYVLRSRKPVHDVYQLMEDNKERIENFNIVFDTIDELEKHRSEIEAIPNASIAQSFRNNLEIGGPNTSKKSALVELLSRLDVPAENVMCCGDAPNDIPMMSVAGLSVAMGNAWGGTKEHADIVTGTNDEDGVAQVIEKYVIK